MWSEWCGDWRREGRNSGLADGVEVKDDGRRERLLVEGLTSTHITDSLQK